MRLQAIINGVQVTIIHVERVGSTAYAYYINSTGAGPGALVSVPFSQSAANVPNIILSTSAIWLA